MDKLAHWIVENIDREFQLDADKREQVEFGLKCLLTLLLSYTLIIVSSWVLGLFPGALIVAGALGLLRSFSGGAHASTSLRCAVIAIMYTNSLAYLAQVLSRLEPLWLHIFVVGVAGVGLGLLLKFAPVDVPEKPITDPMHRKRLQWLSVVSFLVAILISLAVESQYSYAILLGLCWQLLSLTPAGELLARLLDQGLGYVLGGR